MKHFRFNAVVLAGALALALTATAQDAGNNQPTPPAEDQAALEEMGITTDTTETTSEPVIPANENDAQPDGEGGATNESFIKHGTTAPRVIAPMKRGTNTAPTLESNSLSLTATPPDKVVKDGEKGILLNFRAAPLDMVLSHLSDVAGFIIVAETDIRGKVDVISNQPLTKDEAVELLNRVLGKEGYTVLRDGRTLTIVTQTEAKRRNETPVGYGWDATKIQKDQQVITQIVPVRFIGAVQLAKDLQPLMPSQTTMTANEGGNALVITDTRQNIHRLMEIITALDTTVSSLSSVKVFALRYADAKTVADVVKEVFASTDASRSSGTGGRGGRFQFGGGGPFGAMMGGGGGDSSSSGSSGRPGASKVVATADERSNSLVVSAPDDLMPTIEQLVNSVDTNVDDLTEIRVFRLTHADPQETVDLITGLFPDTTSSQNNNQRGGGFFRGPFGGNNDNDTATAGASDRMKKQSKVISVADKRTGSVVVTAARDTMDQIGKMITALDADPAHKKKVHVFDAGNTDPTALQSRLEELFSGQSTSSSRTSSGQAGSQLNTRAQNQNSGSSSSSSSSTRNSSSGNATGSSFGN